MRNTILIALATLILGLVIGFFVGRALLERQWGNPLAVITPDAEQKSAANDADPTPKAGTKVMQRMPLLKSREYIAAMTANDPVAMKLGAVGRDGKSAGLHLVLENRGKCQVTSFSGVAYGFDAYGRPAAVNRNGEHYLAFSSEGKDPIEPGDKSQPEWDMHYSETASLALAHVDAVGCSDGTKWTRQ